MVETTEAGGKSANWRRHVTLKNWTALATFEAGLLMALALAIGWPIRVPADAAGPDAWAAIGFGLASWFLFQGARLVRICVDQRSETGKASPEKRRMMLSELLIWMFVSLLALCVFALLQPTTGALSVLHLELPGRLAIFMALLGASFAPAIAGIVHTERLLAKARPGKSILRDDAISGGSLLFGVFTMVLIVSLAWAAAHDAFEALGPNMGLIATLFVMFAFVFFIVLSSVTRGLNLFQERDMATKAAAVGPATSLTTLVSWIDSILVRIIAPLTGAIQAPDGRHGLGWHHALIIGVMTPLTLLGYALPQPWGLIPIAMAFLFALSVGRRWSWVEGDRETASRLRTTKSKDIHIGFSNDLRDEALLSYAFLFVLVPLTLFQLNEMTGAFCLQDLSAPDNPRCLTNGTQGRYDDWIGFFGLELLKAVPLVDWVEIYGLKAEPAIMQNPENREVAQHLMFGSRVLVDFVVMAALFQAIAIFQRNQTQRKLYDSGQLDVLDPISEEDFFEIGMIKASKADFDKWAQLPPKEQAKNPVIDLGKDGYFTAKPGFLARVEHHVTEQRTAGMPWPYDRNRLNELVRDSRPDLKAGAKWMIRKYGLLAGNPRNQVGQLADRWLDLKIASAKDDVIFVEKQNFEDVVKSAQATPRDFSNLELGRLASLIIDTCNRPEFAYAHMQAFKLIGMLRTRNAVLLLAASVLKPDQVLGDEIWREEIPAVFSLEWRKLRQGQDEMRAHAYAALETMARNGIEFAGYGIGASTYRLAIRLAEQAAEFEATKSRPRAALARDALQEVLGPADA